MNKKSKNHRNRVESRNNRLEGLLRKHQKEHGIEVGEIVTYRRSKAHPGHSGCVTRRKKASSISSYRRLYGIPAFMGDTRPRKLMDPSFYSGPGEEMGRVVFLSSGGKLGRTVGIRTISGEHPIEIEEKYTRRLEGEDGDLINSLNDIGLF